jgi:ferredoxin
MKSILFYFSGTGNSLRTAQLLATELENSVVISIPNLKNGIDLTDVNIVGIVFPIYAWTMPKMVHTFVENLIKIKKKDCYYFVVCTMKSQAGIALEQIQSMFVRAGLTLPAGYKVLMPGNAIVVYDIDDTVTINNTISNAEQQIKKIGNDSRKFNVNLITKNSFLKYCFLKLLGSLVLSMTPDKKYKIDNSCSGCGICKNICPSQNIEIKNGKPLWLKKKCEYCLACIHWCPQQAIQCGKTTITKKRYHHPNVNLKDMILENKA